MINPLKKLATWRRNRYTFAILDPEDSSVTLSKKLFNHIKEHLPDDCKEAKVFTFFIPQDESYGFMVNPAMEYPTQLGIIQYNAKHKCIGYESLNPTVAKILYDYGINEFAPVKLSVTVLTTPQGEYYYKIEKPKR